jgi:hypothetical protein
MERCGYVERRADADDARATLVLFTPRGRRMLATVLERVESIEAGLARELGPSRFEGVRAGLFEIAERFDPMGRLGHPTASRAETNRVSRPSASQPRAAIISQLAKKARSTIDPRG